MQQSAIFAATSLMSTWCVSALFWFKVPSHPLVNRLRFLRYEDAPDWLFPDVSKRIFCSWIWTFSALPCSVAGISLNLLCSAEGNCCKAKSHWSWMAAVTVPLFKICICKHTTNPHLLQVAQWLIKSDYWVHLTILTIVVLISVFFFLVLIVFVISLCRQHPWLEALCFQLVRMSHSSEHNIWKKCL